MVRSRLTLALCAALAALAACGGSAGGGGGTLVDNSTCPYGSSSAGPYKPNPPDTNHVPDHAQVVPEMPHEHVAPPARVTYAHNPPTSGCHYSLGYGQAPIAAGAYPPAPVIPAEYWVHNLEHGYIAVLYNCPKGCDADLRSLQAWMQTQKPDPGLAALAKSDPTFKPYTKIIVIP